MTQWEFCPGTGLSRRVAERTGQHRIVAMEDHMAFIRDYLSIVALPGSKIPPGPPHRYTRVTYIGGLVEQFSHGIENTF